ncbi:lysosomal thioesterase PPT2-A-like isoform X2 [Patiria miniata]|uniref:palmitoyl-CoA hydrolase n=1 Tax=Patiria miniata TaxID=46514 RepID=A0A914AIH9_PATMI|nr:lysosomal thioesterase PPT2-A-like isoform X2 [Patiria miniata]
MSSLLRFHQICVVLIGTVIAATLARGIARDPRYGRPSSPAPKYLPVILVHGIFTGTSTLNDLVAFIKEAHPGTNISNIPLFEDLDSLKPLWEQVPKFAAAMRPIMQQAPNGVILLCFSQGGIMCRGVLETMPDHNVHTFIALSTPQMGQYGDTSYILPALPLLKEDVYKFCYLNPFGQDVSVCNYWNAWKENFLRLKQLVMIGGPDDGVITPWQSSHFGFYDANEKVVEMKDQEVYKMDYFGLKTLDQRNAIKTYTIPGVKHTNWHGNKTVFDSCIKPWLI